MRLNIRSKALKAYKKGKLWMVQKIDLLDFLAKSYDILSDKQRQWYDENHDEKVEDLMTEIKFLITEMKNSDVKLPKYKEQLLDKLKALKLCVSEVNFIRFVAQCLGVTIENTHTEIMKFIPPSNAVDDALKDLYKATDEEERVALYAKYLNEIDTYNPVRRVVKAADIKNRT